MCPALPLSTYEHPLQGDKGAHYEVLTIYEGMCTMYERETGTLYWRGEACACFSGIYYSCYGYCLAALPENIQVRYTHFQFLR